jgi:RHS repeat-associated protein
MFDPYGKVTICNPDGSEKLGEARVCSAFGNPFFFTGRRNDDETRWFDASKPAGKEWQQGLMQFRFRYYDTGLGRFIGRDPIDYTGGPNLYAYVYAKPARYADPFGLKLTVVNPTSRSPQVWGHGTKEKNFELVKKAILALCPEIKDVLKDNGTSFWIAQEDCKVCDKKRCEVLYCVLCDGDGTLDMDTNAIGKNPLNSYDDVKKTLRWNPWGWGRTSQGKLQHPLQILAHELAHMCRHQGWRHAGENKDAQGIAKASDKHKLPGWDNLEEKETIEQWENPIAKEMRELYPNNAAGYNERTDHHGSLPRGMHNWDGLGRSSAFSGRDETLE